MADWGIWSYQVMMFERDDRGAFRGIDHYLPNALVTFNTHDLSTYAGWRSFSDLKLKRSLGIDPGESDDARWHALAMLGDVLRHHAIDRHDLYAVAGFLARTKSRLLAISLEDLLGVVDQPNIPGTVNEHPNWRRRLPVAIERDGIGDRRCRAQGGDRGSGRAPRSDLTAVKLCPCRIEDYGLIGDCETAALVGRDGSIDWLCWPAFDSDACFAALLGTDKHGRWLIAPAEEVTGTSRRYWDNTLILETRFETATAWSTLIDFMPPRGNASDVVRLVRGVRGRVRLRMELVIRFGFGIDIPWVKKTEDGRAAGDLRAGHDGAADAGRDPRRGYDDGRRFRGRRGRDCSLRAHLRPLASAGARADRSRAGLAGHRGVLDRMVQPLHL